jgi:hypothetical protein
MEAACIALVFSILLGLINGSYLGLSHYSFKPTLKDIWHVFFLLAYIIVPGLLFILSYSNFNIIQQHYPATKDLFIILPIACYFYFFFLSKKVLQAIKID